MRYGIRKLRSLATVDLIAKKLGVHKFQVIGHLLSLQDNAVQTIGDPTPRDPAIIESWAGWDGKHGAFYAAIGDFGGMRQKILPEALLADAIPDCLKAYKLYARDRVLCLNWGKLYQEWQQSCPAVNIMLELRKAHAWQIEDSRRCKIRQAPFLGNWFRRAQDRAGPMAPKWDGYGAIKPGHDPAEAARAEANRKALERNQIMTRAYRAFMAYEHRRPQDDGEVERWMATHQREIAELNSSPKAS